MIEYNKNRKILNNLDAKKNNRRVLLHIATEKQNNLTIFILSFPNIHF